MSKIAIAILMAAAFVYAVWLVASGRELPDPRQTSRARRRFLLATLLFVGLLGATSARARQPVIDCYIIAVPLSDALGWPDVAAAMKAIWRTLDPARGEEFRKRLEAAAAGGMIGRKTSKMLAIAFSELAMHKQRTRGRGSSLVLCYKMTVAGAGLARTRENALKQLELLAEARKSGAIDQETASRVHAALARDVQMLGCAESLETPTEWRVLDRLVTEYAAGKIEPGDAALVTAAMIVEMEDGRVPDVTVAKRLATMQRRIETLLASGPKGSDWMDPDIRPNISDALERAGLLKASARVTCYERAVIPVEARSEELKKLQAELLEKNVDAGILDVETAAKAAVATADEKYGDYAVEADIRDYQKKVRRAVRLLYKRGELPSAFVRQIEEAADIEIICFDQAKSLRNDMAYHLRSVFWQPVGDKVIAGLERRNLIPPTSSHRHVMAWHSDNSRDSEHDKERLAEFERLVDNQDAITLDGDAATHIDRSQLEQNDLDYRLRMRRVCRVLVKTQIAALDQLKDIEELIAIPLVGIVEQS